jgi:hypothetical protein
MTMTKTHFTFSIDRWDTDSNVIGHVADIDDLIVAVATYKAACEWWLDDSLTVQQGSRVIADSR